MLPTALFELSLLSATVKLPSSVFTKITSLHFLRKFSTNFTDISKFVNIFILLWLTITFKGILNCYPKLRFKPPHQGFQHLINFWEHVLNPKYLISLLKTRDLLFSKSNFLIQSSHFVYFIFYNVHIFIID